MSAPVATGTPVASAAVEEPRPKPSSSVIDAIRQLSSAGHVGALQIVAALLKAHSDYAPRQARALDLSSPAPGAKALPVAEWIEVARALYEPQKVEWLSGRLVILALPRLDRTVMGRLSANGFLDEIEQEYRREGIPDPVASLLSPEGRRRWREMDAVPSHLDVPAEVDRLGRDAYARALAARLRRVRSTEAGTGSPRPHHPPGAFLLHIHGPWGAGKTSLLGFLRRHLQSEESSPPWVVVEFNAWQHQRIGPPWWWLLNTVYRQALQQTWALDKRRALWLWATEQVWRLWSGWAPYLFALLLLGWLLVVLWASGLATQLLGLFQPAAAAFRGQGPTPPGATGGAPLTGLDALKATGDAVKGGLAVAGLIGTVWTGSVAFSRWLLRSARPAQAYLFSQDPMQALADHFTGLVQRIGRPVAIFVDDLDRCQGSYAVDLLEGIQTVFRDAGAVYVVAADRRWLRLSYEQAYQQFQSAMSEPARPLGHLFMEKTFQLSTSVPRISPNYQSAYWRHLIGTGGGLDEAGLRRAEDDAAQKVRALFDEPDFEERVLGEIREAENAGNPLYGQALRNATALHLASAETERQLEHALAPFAPLLEPNPRAMKRLVNAYGIHRTIDILDLASIPSRQLALWTILTLRWPLLAEYLAEHPQAVCHIHPGPIGNLPEDLAPGLKRLFSEADVQAVVSGQDIGLALDENAIRACAGLSPSGSTAAVVA